MKSTLNSFVKEFIARMTVVIMVSVTVSVMVCWGLRKLFPTTKPNIEIVSIDSTVRCAVAAVSGQITAISCWGVSNQAQERGTYHDSI